MAWAFDADTPPPTTHFLRVYFFHVFFFRCQYWMSTPGPSLARILSYGGGGGPRGGWVLGPIVEGTENFFSAFTYRVLVKTFLGGWVGGLEPSPPPWG